MKQKENKNQQEKQDINQDLTPEENINQQPDQGPDEYKTKIEKLEKEVLDYRDRLLRKAAEFENYKRRTENDQLNIIKYSAEGFIKKLLPVVDDFERSLSHIDTASSAENKEASAFAEGVKMIYDKLIKVLEEQGVNKINAEGTPFDVHFHEAVMQKNDENSKPHTVLTELEKGYVYKDRVIRHSKVIVSDEDSGSALKNNNNGSEENKA